MKLSHKSQQQFGSKAKWELVILFLQEQLEMGLHLDGVTVLQKQQFLCVWSSFGTQKQGKRLEAERKGEKERSPCIRKEGKEKAGFCLKVCGKEHDTLASMEIKKHRETPLFLRKELH